MTLKTTLPTYKIAELTGLTPNSIRTYSHQGKFQRDNTAKYREITVTSVISYLREQQQQHLQEAKAYQERIKRLEQEMIKR